MEKDYLFFDEGSQKFVLTETAVKEELGIDLSGQLNTFGDSNPASVPIRFLKRVSMIVYNHIKKYGRDGQHLNCIINGSPRIRQEFTDALLNQVAYMVNVGDLGLQSGVNLKDGRAMHPSELRGAVRISPDTQDILLNAGLLYCGIGWSGL